MVINSKFNKSKKDKEMKKIFYILASAIVALGAVACENDGLDNIGLEVNGDTVSFIASIDNTKTALNGLETIWDEDDTIVIEWDQNGNDTIEDAEKFSFTNTKEEVNKFSCKAEGLSAIQNAKVVATYSHNGDGKIDSQAGPAGALLRYEGSFAELADRTKGKGFQVQNAFLKFSATEGAEVELTASAEIFSTKENGTVKSITLTGTGADQYVAIAAKTASITYAVNGEEIKTSQENTLAVGKIYPLNFLGGIVSLNPGVWAADGAWFAARFYNGAAAASVNALTRAGEVDEAWVKMTDDNYDGVYECLVPGAYNSVIFCRMDPSKTELSWSSKWDQSADLLINNEKECYAVTGWGTGGTAVGAWGDKPAAPTYAVAGDFNSWGDNAMAAVDGVANVYVAKGIGMEAYKAFKIKIAGSWDTSWGASITYIQQNKYFAAIQGGGDIVIEKAGTYDVYFDRANLNIYLMNSGTNYTSAAQQTANGTAPVTGNMYYFKPNSNWTQSNAKFSGYFWNSGGNKWAELVDSDKDGIYECNLGDWTPTNVIFLRKNPSGFTYNNWDCWNRIGNLTIASGKNFYTMANGVWSQQIESGNGYTGGTWSTK